jgi:hypothetical protein
VPSHRFFCLLLQFYGLELHHLTPSGIVHHLEVMNDLVAKFWRREELCSWLEGPGVMICDLLLRPLPSQARWANHLAEATRRLVAELTT